MVVLCHEETFPTIEKSGSYHEKNRWECALRILAVPFRSYPDTKDQEGYVFIIFCGLVDYLNIFQKSVLKEIVIEYRSSL
jgi:hypothetical protein